MAQETQPPDLLINGGHIWNAFTGEVQKADIAICGDRIAKVGPWSGPVTDTTAVVDATNRTAVPGYIEPHTHPWPFANPLSLGEAAVCRGTTCLVYDQLMLYLAMGADQLAKVTSALSAASLPHIFWMARIASQSRFRDEGAFFSLDAVRKQVTSPDYLGSAEMTRWTDLLDPRRAAPILEILEDVRRHGKINDGHMAGASPKRLAALAATGIRSCHEAITADEALDRLRHGLWVLLRNSSFREDLAALLPCLKETAFHDRIALTTDGAGEPHVERLGMTDHLIATCIEAGVPPAIAYRMATLNPAAFLGLDEDLGAIAPGRIAHINLLDDLHHPTPVLVVCRGTLAARDGKLTVPAPSKTFPWADTYGGSHLSIGEWPETIFALPHDAPNPFPAGRLVNSAITRESPSPLMPRGDGLWPASPSALMLAVTNRSGSWIARGVVEDMAEHLQALATSYTTNAGVLILGRSAEDMAEALRRLRRLGGGTVIRDHSGAWREFGFPMAGIHRQGGFSEGVQAAGDFQNILRACGYPHADPKYTLLFLTTDMLPEVRASEAGWIRVKTGEILYPAQPVIPSA